MEKVIGIHLDIPKPTSKIILQAIKQTNIAYPRYYKYSPHLTLYRCRFPANHFSKLINKLKALKLKPISLKINKVNVQRINQDAAFLSLNFAKADLVKNLHRKVLQPANKLRGQLIRSKDKNRLRHGFFSLKEQQYITRYGHQSVLSLFTPHITLGEVPRAKVKVTVKKITPYLGLLQKHPFILTRMTAGLYDYDSQKEKYTKVIREEEIKLG